MHFNSWEYPQPTLGQDADMPSAELVLDMYTTMLRIRRFEETVVDLVNANEIAGVTHEYVGEEAIATGVCAALLPADVLTSTHRGHGHCIAKGGETSRMLAELMGRVDGYNRGRGGSMHIADLNLGIYGANGIVGAGAPIACGAAYSFVQKDSPQVAVCFFGDGAMNQGVLLESMNMAAIWNLPVVFVCENNMYAQTTPVSESTRAPYWRRAEQFGIPSVQVDGMHVGAVYAASQVAVDRARSGGGPTFLECVGYRFVGHQTAERHMGLKYREPSEIEVWRARDPISLAESFLVNALGTGETLEAIAREIDDELIQATKFARSSEWPDATTANDYMYAGKVSVEVN